MSIIPVRPSSGNIADEVWVEYIKSQTPAEPDDNFKVT
jgi:hypothetical protein